MAKLKFKKDDTDKVLAGSSARMSADTSADLKSKADAGMAQIKADAAKPSAPTKKPSSSGSSFRSAFAEARKGGASTFTWNGKSFNTKLASDAPAKKAPAPAAKAPASTVKSQSVFAGRDARTEAAGKRDQVRSALSGYMAKDSASKVQADSARGSSLRASLDNARAATRVTDDSKAKLGSFMDAMSKPDRWATPGIETTPAQRAKLAEADARRKQYHPNANAKGGKVKKLAKGGKIDGIAKRGLTRGRKK